MHVPYRSIVGAIAFFRATELLKNTIGRLLEGTIGTYCVRRWINLLVGTALRASSIASLSHALPPPPPPSLSLSLGHHGVVQKPSRQDVSSAADVLLEEPATIDGTAVLLCHSTVDAARFSPFNLPLILSYPHIRVRRHNI